MLVAIQELGHAECHETGFDRAVAASLATTAALAGALAANGDGNPASTAASTCRKAEVNPATGHVL
jgi:hypothetical protein